MGCGSVTDPTKCSCLDELFACYHGAPPSMSTLRRLFTLLARWPFASSDNMSGYEDALACLTWSPDPTKSHIKIEPASVVNPGDTSNIPGILVALKDGIQLKRAGIGDTGATLSDYSGRVSSFIGSADIVLTCRHQDADVTCMMADLLLLFLTAVQGYIIGSFRWAINYVPVGQTEPKLTFKEGDADTKWYESIVEIHLDFSYDTFTTREAPRLRGSDIAPVPMGLTTDGAPPPDDTLVPHDGVWPQYHP